VGGLSVNNKLKMGSYNFLTIDLGASNGRVFIGRVLNRKLMLMPVHRFEHKAVEKDGHLRWDWLYIMSEITKGLTKVKDFVTPAEICSLSVSSWAQDFGLLDKDGKLMFFPISYRDKRTKDILNSLQYFIKTDDLVKRVGSIVSPMTTLCQLRAVIEQEPELLEKTKCLLHIADLVHYELCGERISDWTLATASQLLNIKTERWDRELLEMLGIPHHFLPVLRDSPCQIGSVTNNIYSGLPIMGTPVVITAGHDTASATVIFPRREKAFFISLGTWAMTGCFIEDPISTVNNISKYGCGVFGLGLHRWGLLKGTVGWWVLQECLYEWNLRGNNIQLDEVITSLSTKLPARSIINPDDPLFIHQGEMVKRVKDYCKVSGQPIPETTIEVVAVVITSLVLNCLKSVKDIETLTGREFSLGYITGGGTHNPVFCQMMADFFGIPIIAGVREATAIGNILLQARIYGVLTTDEEIWETVSISFSQREYLPRRKVVNDIYNRFIALKNSFVYPQDKFDVREYDD